MFAKRKSYNPKHSFASAPERADLDWWVNSVHYGGNPEHKRNPGDFGLTPPSIPRPDKTLCDLAGVFKREQAIRLLKEGIRRGLVSEQIRSGFPQNVWAVTEDGIAFEAQLENAGNGTYHGYPLPEDDPFREKVFEKWKATS